MYVLRIILARTAIFPLRIRFNTSEGTYGEYKYLNHYEIHIKDGDSDDSVRDLYILVDKEDATYDAIQKSWASSVPNGGIASYIVYSNIY